MIDPQTLSDDELTEQLALLVRDERRRLASLISHLAEFDRRRIHEGKGYPTAFVYCTQVFGYSEDAACKRIAVARASRKYPSILTRLETGKITMTAVVLLSPHLTSENHRALLSWACGKKRREIEKKVASLAPQERPPSSDVVRYLGPQPVAPSIQDQGPSLFDSRVNVPEAPSPRVETPEPAVNWAEQKAPQSIRFAFTGTEALLRKLGRAKELLRHKHPAGHLADIVEEALDALLECTDPERKSRRRKAERHGSPRDRPSPWVRRIPAAIKAEVWRRDGGQCAFRADDGTRCCERGGLELDHVVPFALGGLSNDAANIRLLCRAHNQMLARQNFGDKVTRHYPEARS